MLSTLFRPVCVCCMLALTSCSSFTSVAPEQSAPTKDLHYQIEYSGQTISHVADWFTGKHSNWSKILAHNPGLDPRKLRIGDTVIIPAHMLVRREKFPKDRLRYVGRSTASYGTTDSYRTTGNRPSLPEPPTSVRRAASASTQAAIAQPKALPPITEQDLMVAPIPAAVQQPQQAPEQTAASAPASASDPAAQTNAQAEQRAKLVQNPEVPRPEAAADSSAETPAPVIPAQVIPLTAQAPLQAPLQAPTTQSAQALQAKQIIRDCDGISCVVQHSAVTDSTVAAATVGDPTKATPSLPSPPTQ